MTDFTAETLLALGFKDIARWTSTSHEGSLDYVLNDPADAAYLDERNSLYAFVEGDNVRYIGKTARTIRKRFAGYKSPSLTQRTNWRNNEKIKAALVAGTTIRILVFTPISLFQYGGFDINLAAGLEDALIQEFDPPWNGKDLGHAITEEAEREEMDEVTGSISDESQETANSVLSPSLTKVLSDRCQFTIVLGRTYYNQGLINPGVKASIYLGKHDDPITVSFDDGTAPIISRINRRASPDGSVRIVGRNKLIARWFQAHFEMGDTVKALVLDLQHVILLSKVAP
jgi:hypothetical protein